MNVSVKKVSRHSDPPVIGRPDSDLINSTEFPGREFQGDGEIGGASGRSASYPRDASPLAHGPGKILLERLADEPQIVQDIRLVRPVLIDEYRQRPELQIAGSDTAVVLQSETAQGEGGNGHGARLDHEGYSGGVWGCRVLLIGESSGRSRRGARVLWAVRRPPAH